MWQPLSRAALTYPGLRASEWHGAQTMSVLRRIAAMSAAHGTPLMLESPQAGSAPAVRAIADGMKGLALAAAGVSAEAEYWLWFIFCDGHGVHVFAGQTACGALARRRSRRPRQSYLGK
jgi:hypothetical protein